MKTVIDAVKELKGELNGAAGVCYPEDSYLFYALDGSHYIFDECKDTDGVYQYVCTREEFLATVAECENDFGMCGRGEWVNYVNASKLLLTKDLDKELDVDIWKNAPDGATHLSMGSEDFPACYYKLASDGLMLSNEYTNGWVHSSNDNSWLINNDNLITKPQPTPAFTQEMADNGVQVEAGMRFATEAGEYIAEYTNKKSVVFTDEGGFLIAVTRRRAKPLAPPITLIDGKAYQFEYQDEEITGLYDKMDNEFFILGSSYSVEICTNIQPLTVEVK